MCEDAVRQQLGADYENHQVGYAVEQRPVDTAYQKYTKPDAERSKEGEQGGGSEMAPVELSERRVGDELGIVDGGKEYDRGADEEPLVKLLRQQIEGERRPAGMGDKAGEAGQDAPEPAFAGIDPTRRRVAAMAEPIVEVRTAPRSRPG